MLEDRSVRGVCVNYDPSTWPVAMRSEDVARVFDISEAAARRMIASGRLGKTLRAGRYLCVAKSAVLSAIGHSSANAAAGVPAGGSAGAYPARRVDGVEPRAPQPENVLDGHKVSPRLMRAATTLGVKTLEDLSRVTRRALMSLPNCYLTTANDANRLLQSNGFPRMREA
jgi:hypothetical protein